MKNQKKTAPMKKYLSGGALLMALSACSSAGSLRNGTPTAVYMGSSSASDVVSCVSTAWATKHYQIDAVPLTSGTSLQLAESDSSPVLALVDIVPTGANTKATYYSRMPDDDTWFFQQVKSCM
ncbi:hypothetical protein [Rhodanobacter sp. A1T4]|jgi:hypothetical protein|uniref:hypothetical protein n=1 Tax=Rhodanobacter sp. A1T4 TaxID=2723087 RepID=UPI00160C0DEF|nr:hypothetical protein [Rhodanobacter sp. A1T4]MBB6247895.1 hypothetical protein [Rhodanobacter sp. A1T4]